MNNDYLRKILDRVNNNLSLNEKQEKFLDDFNRLKLIIIQPGVYELITSPNFKYEIVSVFDKTETALVRTIHSGKEQVKTFHWCRKRLNIPKRLQSMEENNKL